MTSNVNDLWQLSLIVIFASFKTDILYFTENFQANLVLK